MSDTLPLVVDGEAVCSVYALTPGGPDSLEARGARFIQETVATWTDIALPLTVAPDLAASPARTVVVTSESPARAALGDHPLVAELAILDSHAFVCFPRETSAGGQFWIVGKTPRGAFNGAVWVRDFLLDGPADALRLETQQVVRTPRLAHRPVYLLSIWGEEDTYTVEDYLPVFDSFARDGATHIYFWLSGHFPSKRYPQTCKVTNHVWDSTEETGIGTVEDQRRLIEAAHERGMEFYIGGGLGGWCGSFNLTHREPETMRVGSKDEQGNDVSSWALCPSHPRAREALVGHYLEMFDALPEADGLYIESADELGECRCERCRESVDELGSRMFGQNQLSLMQEMMAAIWEKHPHAKLAYTIGYSPHTSDPAYYRVVRQMSDDPRIEWMEARGSWEFPGPDGQPLPAAQFSPRILHWEYNDLRTLDLMVKNQWRTLTSGMAGVIMTFSPGFSSGSFYHDVPYPTGKLPYILTHFVYREGTWEPVETIAEMKARVRAGFFGAEVDAQLVEDLWELREILRESAGGAARAENRARVEAMVSRMEAARGAASAKTRATLDLMAAAIADLQERAFPAEGPGES